MKTLLDLRLLLLPWQLIHITHELQICIYCRYYVCCLLHALLFCQCIRYYNATSTELLARNTPVRIPCPMAAVPQVGVSRAVRCERLLQLVRLMMWR